MSFPGATLVATADEFTIDEHDILVDPQSGLPQAAWTKDATVRNKVDVLYDFNDPVLKQDDFGRRQVWTADASVTRHGPQPAIALEARGVRTALGGQALMDQLALGFLQRWGYTPPMLRIAVTFRRHLFEPLDTVRVSHPLIANPITGVRGLDREQFEVLEITPSWLTEGKLTLLLLWTGAIETSAAPTSGGALTLVPGIGTTDDTDVPVPLLGSAIVTTPAGTRKVTIGLKHLSYRKWHCVFNFEVLGDWDSDPKTPDTCQAAGQSHVTQSFGTAVSYRIEYKTENAPDEPGTGGDPTTGWVELLGLSGRGSTAQFDSKVCTASPQTPASPAEDFWSVHFEALGSSPNTYNLKVFFTGVSLAADPCPAHSVAICSSPGCSGSHAITNLTADERALAIDSLTSLT